MTEIQSLITPFQKPGRHRWADPVRYPYKTERSCMLCQIVKVTRHEPDRHPWLEFYRYGERIVCERTPPCEVTS
jgi:hypothetical protein